MAEKKRKVGLKINIDYLLVTAYNRVQVAPFFTPILAQHSLSLYAYRGTAHNSWFSSALPTGGGATAILNYELRKWCIYTTGELFVDFIGKIIHLSPTFPFATSLYSFPFGVRVQFFLLRHQPSV